MAHFGLILLLIIVFTFRCTLEGCCVFRSLFLLTFGQMESVLLRSNTSFSLSGCLPQSCLVAPTENVVEAAAQTVGVDDSFPFQVRGKGVRASARTGVHPVPRLATGTGTHPALPKAERPPT